MKPSLHSQPDQVVRNKPDQICPRGQVTSSHFLAKKLLLRGGLAGLLFLLSTSLHAYTFPGGNGTSGNPYQIATPADLNGIREISNLTGIYFILTADIDLTAACQPGGAYYNSGRGWVPFGRKDDGGWTNQFLGNLDGQGHTITGLMINRPSTEMVGLCAYNYGTIRNVIMKNVSVTGTNFVGALAGRNGYQPDGYYGYIWTSCVTGTSCITGNGSYAGGLVGWNDIGSWIRQSYSSAAVTTTVNYAGGLAGYNKSGVEYSYAYGKVTCTGAGTNTGGLIGYCQSNEDDGYRATVTYCYYNSATSGRSDNDGRGVPKTIAEMMQQTTFTNWDFSTVWNITSGSSYPYLRTATATPLPSPCLSVTGSFTADNKVYDGTAAAIIAGNNLSLTGDMMYGDVVTLTGVTAAFSDANAGTGKIVSIAAASLDGADAGKYLLTLTGAPVTTANITPATVTIGGSFTVNNKVYDGTAAATIATNSLTLSGVVSGDNVTLAPVAAFVDANVGTGKTVSLTSSSLGGTKAGNYTLSFINAPTTTANITPATVTIGGSFTVNNKVYDGTTAATIATNSLTLSGVVSGDNVTLAPVAAFVDANVGTGKTVSLTSSSLSGTKAGNYTLSFINAPTATAHITIAGSGTSADPWQIRTAADLDAVRNNLSACYKVMNDIDLSAYVASGGAGYNDGAGWNPITGSGGNGFQGVFDGGGYTISGLYINRPDMQNVGFFGYCYNAGIHDLTITNAVVIGGYTTGCIAGYICHNSTINNCHVTQSSVSTTDTNSYGTGGLVGYSMRCLLSGCHFSGSVTGYSYTGGLVGKTSDDSGNRCVITNCYALSTVSGSDYVGGLVGNNNISNIISSYSSSTVTGSRYVGGLAGYNSGKIENSYSNSKVEGSGNYIGGLIGFNYAERINNCYSYGQVTGTGSNVGGLVGTNTGPVTNSYYNSTTSGQSDTGKGTPLATIQMVQQAAYSGWDFTNVWAIQEGTSYPYLRSPVASPLPAPIALTITGNFTASDKVYDGTVAATIATNNLTLVGVVSGDEVTLNAAAAFADANVGTGKTVSLTGSTLTGSDAGNYILSLSSAPEAAADITIFTPDAPAAPTPAVKTATSITLDTIAGGEYRINGGAWQDSPGFTELTPLTVYSFTQRIAESDNNAVSAESPVLTVKTTMTGGSGTSADPWQIYTAAELDAVRDNLSGCYKLMNDIDLTAYLSTDGEGYDDGAGWNPIGDENNPFTGTFEGGGHTISGLFLNRSSQMFCGLFGVSTGAVKNIVLKDASLAGDSRVALVGYQGSGGVIENCCVTGNSTFTGAADCVGGIAGYNAGKIKNCYSNAFVSGTRNTGSLAGYNSGSIQYCYAYGKVTHTDSDRYGSLLGYNEGGTVTGCYYNNSVNSFGDSYAAGRTAAQMVQQAAYSGWDFSTVWNINEGNSYPYLRSALPDPLPTPLLTIGGSFTVSNKVYDGTIAAVITNNNLTLEGSIASGDVVTLNAAASFADANTGVNKIVGLTNSTLTGANAGNYILSLAGAPVATADITFRSAVETPPAPTPAGKTATSVTLNAIAGCEYRITSGDWQDSPEFTGLTPFTAYTFTQRVKATSNSNASPESPALTVITSIGGSGTEADPWQITTAAELDAVRDNLSHYYKVMNDIDLTAYAAPGGAGYNDGAGWEPIGTEANRFTGTFDGGGHTISGLALNRTSQMYCGLFGASTGTVKNTVLKDASLSGDSHVAFVGYQGYGGVIENCCVTGNSTFNGVTDCVGGIAGFNEGTVKNCYSNASVSGTRNVGGLAGYSSGNIQYCYTYGKVTHTGSDRYGSLLGYKDGGTVTDCYYNSSVNSFGDTYATGKTTTQMVQQAAYAGWDFSAVWTIQEGTSYPYLRNAVPNPLPVVSTLTIEGSFTVDNKVYDGTTAAVIAVNNLTLVGVVSGNEVTLNAEAAFADANVGTGKTVSLTGSTLTGADAGNYILSFTGAPVATANITVFTPAAPAAPTPAGKTAASVTLNAIVGGEYRINGGYWQDSPEFTGLTLSTAYTFTQRVKATSNSNASPESPALTVITSMAGSGTSADPWQITTAAELDAVRDNLSGCYKLMNDIDLTSACQSGGAFYNDGLGWNPIGRDGPSLFKGVFDGGGHTISGLALNRTSQMYCGLFGASTGTVKNTVLKDASLSGDSHVAFVGYQGYGGVIENCCVTGNSTFNGVTDCVGGIAGFNEGTVKNCYSNASVSGTRNVGGLAGYSSGNIQYCYTYGKVTHTGSDRYGSLLGYKDGGTVTDCYYNSSVNSFGDSYATGKTTAQMVQQATYSGWDFSNVWAIQEGASYPYLLSAVPDLLPVVSTLTIGGSFTVDNKVYDGTTVATIATNNLTLVGTISSGDVVTLNAAAAFADADIGSGKTVGLTNSTLTGADAGNYILSFSGAPTATADVIPTAPTLAVKTATSVTLNALAGYEYRINGGIWQDSPVFTGLTSAAFYSFTQRVKATSNNDASAESPALTVKTPWQITNAVELDAVRNHLSDSYILMNDIDLTAYVASDGAGYNGGAGWNPIGDESNPFTGTFEGGGHTISGLVLNRSGQMFCGLFGGSSGAVKNIVLKDASLAGDSRVALVGYQGSGGVIESCCVTGNSTFSGISDCVGGIAGFNAGTIKNCYSGASVSGTRNVGSLAGYSKGSIQDCYAYGAVTHTGDDRYGSCIGFVEYSTVTGCYYVSGVNSFGDSYAAGKTTAEMMQQATFAGWDFTTVWTIEEGSTYPYFRTAVTPPTAPMDVTATAGDGQADVSFTAPASDGGSPITGYTVTSDPEGITATGSGSPITVTGLTNGVTYTFTVTAANAAGTSPASEPSNSVTPSLITGWDSPLPGSVSIYPNPVRDVLYIEIAGNRLPEVKVYSLQGVLLLQTKAYRVDISAFVEGIYLVDVNGTKVKVVKK